MRQFYASLGLTLGLVLGLGGCPNKEPYPACSKDKHCQEGESCVDNLCQNCKTDDECKGKGPNGEDLVCVDFRCEAPASECESNDQCELGMICVEGTCQFCTDDSQCESGVCSESGRCPARLTTTARSTRSATAASVSTSPSTAIKPTRFAGSRRCTSRSTAPS
jgi:peptidoglycan-associated lipoprotein